MNKLEIAKALLDDILIKVKEHKDLEDFVRNWKKKNKDKSFWEEKNKEVRDKLEKSMQYYPSQMEQQIVVIRRLLNEGKGELQDTWRLW